MLCSNIYKGIGATITILQHISYMMSSYAILLYNELEVKTKKAKCRNVFFNGIVAKSNKDWIMEMIMNKTGWNKQKVIRSSTKP